MSWKLLPSVWKIRGVSHTSKLVLLALADFANDNGECWPSHARLAEMCGLSRKAVVDQMNKLEKRGYIAATKRNGTGSRYRLNLITGPENLAPPLLPQPVTGGDRLSTVTGNPVSQQPVTGGDTHLSPAVTAPVTGGDTNPKEPLAEPSFQESPSSIPTNGSQADVLAVLDHLNFVSARRYRPVKATLRLISARLKESEVTVAGCRMMIERQMKMWRGTRMEEYMRPKTLFAASNFASYYDSRDLPIPQGSSNAPPNPRVVGTCNEGTSAQYRGIGREPSFTGAPRPTFKEQERQRQAALHSVPSKYESKNDQT